MDVTLEEMTLLHHVAFDGNKEVLNLMTKLPYFKEVVDGDNNDVFSFSLSSVLRWAGRHCFGPHQEET
jgi:hypothetical protein